MAIKTSSDKTSAWVLGDQLNPRVSALQGLSPSECVVFMVESLAVARRRPYHKQKLALVWSAMRHFALELRELGYTVDYYEAQPSARPALEAHIDKHRPARMRLMETAEYDRSSRLARAVKACGVDAEIAPNNSFLSDRAEFARVARGKKRLLMETLQDRRDCVSPKFTLLGLSDPQPRATQAKSASEPGVGHARPA